MKKELSFLTPIILMLSICVGAPESQADTIDSSNATLTIVQPEIPLVPQINPAETTSTTEAPTAITANATEITETEPETVPNTTLVVEVTADQTNVPEPETITVTNTAATTAINADVADATVSEEPSSDSTAPATESTDVAEAVKIEDAETLPVPDTGTIDNASSESNKTPIDPSTPDLPINTNAAETPLVDMPEISTEDIPASTFEATLSNVNTFTTTAEAETNLESSIYVTQVDTDQKVISLTISDITNESNVVAILANLDYLGIKATFFVDGTADQTMITKIVAAGHEIGNQAYTHTDTTLETPEALAADIVKMEAIIQSTTGLAAEYFRAPFGAYDASVLETVGSLGYKYTIGWTVDTQDWTGTLSASDISNTVVSTLAPGAIYLMHANDAASTTPHALLDMSYQARALGYTIVPIGDLLWYEGYYEEEYTGPSKEIYGIDTDQKVIALTFDDGDNAGNLGEILDNLAYLGIKATFFMDGNTDPYLLQRIVDEGHQLGNHTYSHDFLTSLSDDQVAYQLETMENLIQDYTGTSTVPYYRPPYGYYDASTLEVAGNLGYKYTIMWTYDTIDYSGNYTASQLSTSIMDHLDPGYIYLMHANDGAYTTPDSLWYIVPQVLDAGYTFVTIDQLLAFDGVYGDINVDAYLASLDNAGYYPEEYVNEVYL